MSGSWAFLTEVLPSSELEADSSLTEVAPALPLWTRVRTARRRAYPEKRSRLLVEEDSEPEFEDAVMDTTTLDMEPEVGSDADNDTPLSINSDEQEPDYGDDWGSNYSDELDSNDVDELLASDIPSSTPPRAKAKSKAKTKARSKAKAKAKTKTKIKAKAKSEGKSKSESKVTGKPSPYLLSSFLAKSKPRPKTSNIASSSDSPEWPKLPPSPDPPPSEPASHKETPAPSRTRLPHVYPQNQPQPNGPTRVAKESTPGRISQVRPPDPVDETNPPGCNHPTAAKNPSPLRVAEQGLDQNETSAGSENPPAQSPPDQSAKNPYNSCIESLYASRSPKQPNTELEHIELDSEPGFKMMEQMELSNRRVPSQSQRIKKEEDDQPQTPLKNQRHLKRQRSRPSQGHTPSQVPTQDPRTGSGPVKRLRVKEPQPSDLAVALNDRRKHPDFWDLDGTAVLQVDDVLFRVVRSTLSKVSPWFQRLFSKDFENIEVMAGCPVYMIEEDLSHLDFASLLRGLENGLEYAFNPPHYLRIVSIFRAASLLEFDTLRKWSLGCLEKRWPADLPPPSKPSRFGSMIPWAEETLEIANLLDVSQLSKRAYWELCTRPGFGKIDAEVNDDEMEEILPTRSQLPGSVLMDLVRLREKLLPEWMRIRSPPIGVPCARATRTLSTSTTKAIPCPLDYASWYKVISETEVNEMTIDDRRMDPISALEAMIVEIDWEKEGGFCKECVTTWKDIWTKDREKIWRNLGDWLRLGTPSGS